jgi:hypothetical protein
MLPMEDRMLLQDVFNGIQLAPETIDEIMTMLDAEAQTVDAGQPLDVDGSWFGGSSTGGHRLATNTAMAHQAIVTEMKDMVAGLRGYRDNIKLWAQDMTNVDQDIATVMTGFETAADCVTSPTFTTQCSLPTEGEDD